MPIDSQEGPPKTEVRAEAFSELREQSHTQIERETAERIKSNPKPSEDEINAGAFPEMLEPQVRDAVFEMRKKGYATESSGFGGKTGEVQSIDGYFEIDEKTERALRDLGVQVGRDEGFGPKYAFLRFTPDEPSLEKIKAKWDEIAELLPDRGQQAELSVSGHAEEFIKEYAPERTDALQRIDEIREQHDKETEEAIAKKGAEASERALGPFSPEEIKTAQSWASEYVVGYIKGERGLKGEYSDDEIKLLNNLGAKVRKAMEENPLATINVDFSQNPEAYATWTKLINRMARGSIEARRRTQDQAKIDEVRDKIGLPKQPEVAAPPEAVLTPAERPLTPETETTEKEKFMGQVRSLLESSWKEAQKRGLSFKDFLEKGCLAGTMYNSLIHEANGVPFAEYTKYYQEQFPGLADKFDAELDQNLQEATKESNIKFRPEAQRGMVWFKNNAPERPDTTDYRYYLNVPPEKYGDAAKTLAKLSQSLEQYGIQFKFKFRRDFKELNRTDTCIAYLELPQGASEQLKQQWQEYVENYLQAIPEDTVRQGSSLFTTELKPGVSKAEDKRPEALRSDKSYTSHITDTLGRLGLDLLKERGDAVDRSALDDIIRKAEPEFKNLNYF